MYAPLTELSSGFSETVAGEISWGFLDRLRGVGVSRTTVGVGKGNQLTNSGLTHRRKESISEGRWLKLGTECCSKLYVN